MRNLTLWHLVSLLAIVCLATWLRTFNLDAQGILYGDAAHDLWSAQQAVEAKQLPLLGIESSMPMFRQGPVTVWLNMVLFILFGYSLFPYSLVYSLTSVAAVVAIFVLVRKELGTRAALLASLVLAVSPLAVAHARVPFIITPLPLVLVVWLWCVLRLKHGGMSALFWAFFSWGVLFQFELAVTPLFFVVLIEAWRHYKPLSYKETLLKKVAVVIGGTLLGLLPQVLHDITHRGEQLGKFGAWVGYRIASAFIPSTDHALGVDKVKTAVGAIAHYTGKIVAIAPTPAPNSLAIIFLLLAIFALALNIKKHNQLPPLLRITTYSAVILLLAFLIHGAPSEAYFPPFLVLIPIILASWWHHFRDSLLKQTVTIALLFTLSFYSITSMQATSFFTDTSHHFNYGPSTGDQRYAVQLIHQVTPKTHLKTTNPGGIFPNYFDNLKWLAAEQQLSFSDSLTSSEAIVWVENENSPLLKYPGAYIINEQPYTLIWLP